MLYILTGLPYSGKTTLTKELVKKFGFSSVCMDDIINEHCFDVEKMNQDDWDMVYTEGYQRLKRLLIAGKTAVLDLANLKRSERDTAKKIAENLGVDWKLIYLQVTRNEIIKRRLTNDLTKERSQLEQATVDRALHMFEEPTVYEKYIPYNQNVNVAEWMKENSIQ